MPIDKRYVVNLSGRDYPTYPGILSEAHRRGLGSIETQLIQVPTEENGNVAIVKATVTMYPGLGGEEFSDRPPPFRTFEGYGDASPKNVNPRIASALLRMAETRAKGRALRDAIDCGETMLEELPGDEADARTAAPPARARTAETMERAEQPMPISTPGERPAARHEKGFEERFVDESAKVFRRVDLVKFAESSLGEALKLGLLLEPITPAVASNEHLVAWGLRVRPILAEARKGAEAAA